MKSWNTLLWPRCIQGKKFSPLHHRRVSCHVRQTLCTREEVLNNAGGAFGLRSTTSPALPQKQGSLTLYPCISYPSSSESRPSGPWTFMPLSYDSAASVIGRIHPGYISDKVRCFNKMTVASFLSKASIVCLWIPFDQHRSHAGIEVFAFAYGLISEAYINLLVPCAAKSGTLETLGQRYGTFQLIISVS